MISGKAQEGEVFQSIETDFQSAYARLAPHVTEARAYLECGEIEKARESMYKAVCVIDSVSNFGNLFCALAAKPLSGFS